MNESRFVHLEHLSRQGLRLALVVTFLIFGCQKFTAFEAHGIAPLVSNSPLTAWTMNFGVRDMSRMFGSIELTLGALLATGLVRERSRTAIVGATGSCFTYLTTLSFLLTTPGVFAPHEAPVLSPNGLFLVKDLVLLAASAALLAQSLAARQGLAGRIATARP